MEPYTIYLAGLIDTTQPQCDTWRKEATDIAKRDMPGMRVWNPLAAHDNLAAMTSDNGITSHDTTSADIILRDYRAVSKCDLIVAHLETWASKRALVGTICELAWAWERQIPIIGVCEETNYMMRKHPFISSFITHYFTTVSAAMDHVRFAYFRMV